MSSSLSIDSYSEGQSSLWLVVWFVLALLFLNALLSFVAVWPTVFVKPDTRLAPEFVGLMVVLFSVSRAYFSKSNRLIAFLAAFYLLLVLGHYADAVVPHIFGRPINLYWDIPQIPRFVWVTVKGVPWWVTTGALIALALSVWFLHRLVFVSMQAVSQGFKAFVPTWLFCIISIGMLGFIAPHYSSLPPHSNYVSKPVLPAYWKEAKLLWNAFDSDRAEQLLPPSTVVMNALSRPSDQVLQSLHKRDVMLMFLESYGALLYDQPQAAEGIRQTREQLEQAIASSGRHVVSAFFTSPTFGGASDLAHMSLLSGIELPLENSQRHDLLLTTGRPTLIDVFQYAGYEVFGLYHSVAWDWAERAYYGYDQYLSGPDLDYKGPAFGYWKIPDQYALAKYEAMFPRDAKAAPRMTFFATISTHFPFYQVPPYQPDWKRLLTDNPFETGDALKAQSEQVSWDYMLPDYLRTINYNHQWLAGYFSQDLPRESIYVLIGDHQPTGNIAGESATWDVPVFVISKDDQFLDRFRDQGFTDGMTPGSRQSKGGLHDLTSILLQAFE